MQDYIIMTDATIDLPMEVVEKYDLKVIPMSFQIGETLYKHYPDERQMSSSDFYQHIRDGAMPVTSQINPTECMECMKPYLEKGLDLLYIVFSTGLSGTFQSAMIAANELMEEFPNRKIVVVDSLCASVGEGYLVMNAAIKKSEGMSLEQLEKWVINNRHNVRHWFTVDDLNHLKRGGRVSAVEAALGSALNIKPIISLDNEGRLTVVAKVRGSKKATQYLYDKMVEEGIAIENQTVIVGHSDSLQKAQDMKEAILEKGLAKEVIVANIGPVIGTHVGPGMTAVTFLGNAGQ